MMTQYEWIQYARDNKDVLEELIRAYHPALMTDKQLKITAPNAERACQVVRDKIKEETKYNPLEYFRVALSHNDIKKIYGILNSAWFGVPESTDCWRIEGFKEAVALLEDMPESD